MMVARDPKFKFQSILTLNCRTQAGPPLKMVSERARLVQLAQMDGKLSSWNKPFVDPYVPPKDLYIYWGSTSAKGTVASQLTGGAGDSRARSSKDERIYALKECKLCKARINPLQTLDPKP